MHSTNRLIHFLSGFPSTGPDLHRVAALCILSLSVLWVAAPSWAATLVVNSTGDAGDSASGDGLCFTGLFVATSGGGFAAECTLRAAIEEGNALAGADVVEFSAGLPKVATVVEIRPNSPLPFIQDPLTIDGYSADGYDLSDPDEKPVINLSGSNLVGSGVGLLVWAGGSGTTIRGLAVFSFPSGGIVVSAVNPQTQNVTIEGCHVGIWRGLFYSGNGLSGIEIRGSRNIVVGRTCGAGACVGQRNVIAASEGNGIRVLHSNYVEVAGNRIGTDTLGVSTFVPFGGATPNQGWGIEVLGGGRNRIGQSLPGGENLVSGNATGGIQIDSFENLVMGNRIGTNQTGTASLANTGTGLNLLSGPNTIGAVGSGRNLISGNTGAGIHSTGPNRIVGNVIGLRDDETGPIGNGSSGIFLQGSGALVRENTLGGNGLHGMSIFGDSHQVFANRVGTNAAGDDLQNGLHGIVLSGAHSVEIGQAGAGNIIGFNHYGIGVSATAGANWIEGNYVGTNEVGGNLGNTGAGIYVSNTTETVIGAPGGLTNGSGNVIGFNGGSGVSLNFNAPGAVLSRIVGNFIGTNASGDPMGNANSGVATSGSAVRYAIGADLTVLPDQVAAHQNVIAFNEGIAISVDPSAQDITARGNEIYANGGGAVPIDLAGDGPTDNDVGDVDTGANHLQNAPEFVAAQTQFNEETGDLEVRYRVHSNEADSAYPLTIDYYLITEPGGFADVYVGSDVYPAASATLNRSVAITPPPGLEMTGMLLATATDAEGNTSEFSRESIPVPEPGFAGMLIAGAGLLAARIRRV